MPVGFVIVSADVEFLGLAPPSTSISLRSPFCCENTVVLYRRPHWVSNFTPNKLWLPVIKVPGKGMEMCRFKVFQDVVLFALETDVHLVFKVEQRFGVVVGSSSILSPIFPPIFS